MLYPYSFADRKRDLASILTTVIRDESRFISNFRRAADATRRKHEYWEDQLTGRGVTASAISSGVLTVSSADAAKLRVGTMIIFKDDPALFSVSAVSGTSVMVTLAAANGSSLTAGTLPAAGGSFIIVSIPMAEGSVNGDGDENYSLGGTEWNATQIFRKEIVLSGSALAVSLYGSADNQLHRQTAFALADLARDLNLVALFGRRVEAAEGVCGETGGLYYFACKKGCATLDAKQGLLTDRLIRAAADAVNAQGGEPTQILCSPGQARVLSSEYGKDRIQILRSDDRWGAYVAVIDNEFDGRDMTIIADPDVPDTDAWVLDPACFALAHLSGHVITDVDATPKGFDGIRRIATGELTFEFRNVRQRCCRIKNLMQSANIFGSKER